MILDTVSGFKKGNLFLNNQLLSFIHSHWIISEARENLRLMILEENELCFLIMPESLCLYLEDKIAY